MLNLKGYFLRIVLPLNQRLIFFTFQLSSSQRALQL